MECGNYSKEETIVFLVFCSISHKVKKYLKRLVSVVLDYCNLEILQKQGSDWLLKYFEHFKTTNKSQKCFLLRKLFKGGNYSKEETINYLEVLTAETIQGRKVFKGGNYSRKYGRLIFYKTTYLVVSLDLQIRKIEADLECTIFSLKYPNGHINI